MIAENSLHRLIMEECGSWDAGIRGAMFLSSVIGLVEDEDRMMRGHWLVLVF